MALLFSSTAAGANPDYTKYLFARPTKTDRKNEPVLFDFSLVNWDGNMQLLHRGNYITFDTATYPNWFTGYVTTEPELEYLGTTKRGGVITPIWGYKYQATSDDLILNLNPIGILPPFVNTTQGAVLKALANILAPGKFDTSNIQNGLPLASYTPDPTHTFSDIVKEFADSAFYRFSAKAGKLYFVPADSGTAPLTLDGNDKHFTPSNLKIRPVQEQIINDAIVLGGVEPQGYINEYWVGDGFTALFPLISSAYGVDSTVLLDDDFSGGQIDTQKWAVFDTVNNWIRTLNGFVNVLGGSANNSFDVYLEAANLLPMEGKLRITHGEYDFVNTASTGVNGVVCGLWSQAPNSSYTGCFYGIEVNKNGTVTTLYPIVNGVKDSSQSMTVDFTKRYVIRTIVDFKNIWNLSSAYGYITQSGTVGSTAYPMTGDVVFYQTILVEIDPSTGNVTNTVNWYSSSVTTSNTQYFAYYIPLASNDLHCTMTGVTISTPMQATLQMLYKNGLSASLNGAGAGIGGTADACRFLYQTMTGDGSIIAKVKSVANISANSKAGLMIRQSTATGDPEFGVYVTPSSGIVLVSRATAGAAATTTTVASLAAPYWLKVTKQGSTYSAFYSADGFNWTQIGTNTSITMSANLMGLAVTSGNTSVLCDGEFDHVVTPYPATAFTGVDVGTVGTAGTSTTSGAMATNGQAAWVTRLVGPNEIDSLDGMAPVATIVDANSGATTRSSKLGTPQYNPGQASLQFFKDTTAQVTDVPQVGDLVHLSYRRAGVAIGRVSSLASILAEATLWGDTGLRTVTVKDLKPAPRTAAECEAAAAALINEGSYQHYEGDYTLDNHYSFVSEPVSGAVLKFQNLPTGFPTVQAEVINEVKTLMTSSHPVERFQHTVTFGKPDRVRKLLANYAAPENVFQPQDTAEIPDIIDVSAFGNVFAPDVTSPSLTNWDSTYLYFNTNQTPPINGGFEVRYTDDQWGADTGKNLIGRFTTSSFTVPRTARGKICFVKAYDARNKLLYSEDMTNAAWTKSASTTVSNITAANPNGDLQQISSVVFGANNELIYQTSQLPAASTQVSFSVSVKGTAGKTIQLVLLDGAGTTLTSSNVNLTGAWQRVNLVGTYSSGASGNARVEVKNISGAALTISMTWASLEAGAVETTYIKTVSTVFGAYSRYAAGLHVEFPLIPPAPTTVSVDYTNKLHPVFTITLPDAAPDVWGVEVRDSDNITVLLHQDLTDASFTPTLTYDNSVLKTRNLSIYVYFYNLLGELSTGYNATFTIPTPAASGLTVDEPTKMLKWSGTNYDFFTVEIDRVSSAFGTETVNTTTKDPFFQLSDLDFFSQRWFRVTPGDALGNGTAITSSHVFTPTAVIEFNSNEAQSVLPPAGPTTDATVPSQFTPYTPDYISESWQNYADNYGRT